MQRIEIEVKSVTSDNLQRARTVYEAFGAGDFGTVLEAFAPDIEWTQPGTTSLSGIHRGRDAVAELFLALAARGLVVEPLEFHAADDQVVAINKVTLAGDSANEVDRMTFRDGAIVAIEHIGDTQMLARGLGED